MGWLVLQTSQSNGSKYADDIVDQIDWSDFALVTPEEARAELAAARQLQAPREKNQCQSIRDNVFGVNKFLNEEISRTRCLLDGFEDFPAWIRREVILDIRKRLDVLDSFTRESFSKTMTE